MMGMFCLNRQQKTSGFCTVYDRLQSVPLEFVLENIQKQCKFCLSSFSVHDTSNMVAHIVVRFYRHCLIDWLFSQKLVQCPTQCVTSVHDMSNMAECISRSCIENVYLFSQETIFSSELSMCTCPLLTGQNLFPRLCPSWWQARHITFADAENNVVA